MGLKCYILSEKQKKANDLGIDLRVDGNMSGIELSAIDICTILSNVIDNAIEAVEQTDGEKYIDISFKKHKDYLFICEKILDVARYACVFSIALSEKYTSLYSLDNM